MLSLKSLIGGGKSKQKLKTDSIVAETTLIDINFDGLTPEDFVRLLKFGQPSNKILKYESLDFMLLPYGLIKKDIPLLQKQNRYVDVIVAVLESQYSSVDLSKATGNELLSFLIWIKSQQDFISNIESKFLARPPKPELVAAGIAKLDEFGVLPTIDRLAKGNILDYERIEKMQYYKVYEKLKLDTVQQDIQEAHEELIKNKNTHL